MQFPYTSPRGAYIWRSDLTDGFLRYKFGGPIFGGAYTWRGLFLEFYGTHEAERFRTDRSCLFSEINSNLNDWCSSFDSCYLNIFFCYLCNLDRLQYILACRDKQRILWCCYNTHDLHHSYALLFHTRLCLQKTI